LFWIDGLGWFEATKLKKLQPDPGQAEYRVQLRLTKWSSACE
jgi:hypothetical protein